MQSDKVRTPNDNYYNAGGHTGTHPQPPVSTISGQAPPPYNGDTSYDSGYDPYGTDVSISKGWLGMGCYMRLLRVGR